MGGTVTLGSAPGLGSRFCVELPLPVAAPPAIACAGVAADLPRRSLHVLLAEDNPVNQLIARLMLQGDGHTVEVVASGDAAVRAWRERAFDLVLMDLQMPVMDGFEATAVIRSLERARGGHTPIIALTAHAMRGDRERCLGAAMDGYVSKPVDRAALRAEILRLAGGVVPPMPLSLAS